MRVAFGDYFCVVLELQMILYIFLNFFEEDNMMETLYELQNLK